MKIHDYAKIVFRVFGLGVFVIGLLKGVIVLAIWIWHLICHQPPQGIDGDLIKEVYAAVQLEVDRMCLIAGALALAEIIIGILFFILASKLADIALIGLFRDSPSLQKSPDDTAA